MIEDFRSFRHLIQDRKGVTVVEFAFVFGPLMLILLGLIDIGYRVYAASIVEGTLQQAARLATIGDKSSSDIDNFIKKKINDFSSAGTVTIEKTNYFEFSNIKKSEKLTADTAPLGVWNTGDCYEDLNNNGKWDTVAGRDGLGGSEDIVFYQVALSYPRLVPMGGFLGWSDTETVTINTIMRNQPYAAQMVPTNRCTSK